jgi:hypothetical protein
MQIYVEIPEDIDNSWMKGELKPNKQQILKDNNFILLGLQPDLPSRSPRCPDHAVFLKGGYVAPVNQASPEGVHHQNFLRDSNTPSLRGHDYELLRSKRRVDGRRESYSETLEV